MFKIVQLENLQQNKQYRLVLHPSCNWSRNKGIFTIQIKNDKVILSSGTYNSIFDIKDYGKEWGLQEVI